MKGAAQRSWCVSVRRLVERYGWGSEWFTDVVDDATLKQKHEELIRRIQEADQRVWMEQLGCHESLRTARVVSDQDRAGKGVKQYLMDRRNVDGVVLWSQLRSGTAPLMCTLGKKLQWPERLHDCPVCRSGYRETEAHFLVVCGTYDALRQRLLFELRRAISDSEWRRWRCAFERRDEAHGIRLLLSSGTMHDNDRREADSIIKNFLVKMWKLRTELCGRWTVQCKNGVKRLLKAACS